MSSNETNNTSEENQKPTQAEITQEYQHMKSNGRRVAVAIGRKSLDRLMGLSIIDESNLAAQIRRSVAEYAERRMEDPTFPQQLEDAQERFDKERELARIALGPDLMPDVVPIEEPEEQLPETD